MRKSGGLTAAAIALFALSLAGCVTLGDDRPGLPAAQLPTYSTGDLFLFTADRWEKVLDAGRQRVVWAEPGVERRERSPNFIVANGNWRAVPSRQAGWDGGPHTLWPLRVGATADFYEVTAGGERRWACRVTGTLQADVPAGSFDAFRVRCWTGRKPGPVDERIWYYAPAIGHYVLYLEKQDGKNGRRQELVARIPNLTGLDGRARESVNGTFQAALEKQLSGSESTVRSAAGQPLAEITPLATFRNPDGTYCRTYRMVLQTASAGSLYPGVACRAGDGTWRVPKG